MKKYLIIGIYVLVFISLVVAVEVFYDEEQEYQNALNKIDDYKKICESAGFVFEEVGNLKSPEEQKQNLYSGWNYVSLRCYEIRGDVKVYHNLGTMEYSQLHTEEKQ